MAKKKGATLSDLNEFLKKDPNSLSEVDKLSDAANQEPVEVSLDAVVQMIRNLARNERSTETATLLKVIERTLEEKSDESSADILLMNTVLYLQHAESTDQKLKDILKS